MFIRKKTYQELKKQLEVAEAQIKSLTANIQSLYVDIHNLRKVNNAVKELRSKLEECERSLLVMEKERDNYKGIVDHVRMLGRERQRRFRERQKASTTL